MKKYLFFDIECANCYNNCAKLFSLGYVVTDENFNIIREKEDVLIGRRGLNVEIMIVSETLRRVKGRTHISI